MIYMYIILKQIIKEATYMLVLILKFNQFYIYVFRKKKGTYRQSQLF